jgi:hypothetical protein
MQAEMDYVRGKFPRAESAVKGGTREMAAMSAVPAEDERWVIFADNCPDAATLGEGSTIESAWESAARNLKSQSQNLTGDPSQSFQKY